MYSEGFGCFVLCFCNALLQWSVVHCIDTYQTCSNRLYDDFLARVRSQNSQKVSWTKGGLEYEIKGG